LHVPANADPEQRRKLPLEMVLGERSDVTEHFHAQIFLQMALYKDEHPVHPSMIVIDEALAHPHLLGTDSDKGQAADEPD
jgi:hypothetical protein